MIYFYLTCINNTDSWKAIEALLVLFALKAANLKHRIHFQKRILALIGLICLFMSQKTS